MNDQATHFLLVEDEKDHAVLVRYAFEEHRGRYPFDLTEREPEPTAGT